MRLTLNTAPTIEPVSLAEAKDHLRVTSTDEDAVIDVLIQTAREHVEEITGRALITQTWKLYRDRWHDPICLPRAPLQSVGSIHYLDSDGNDQTLATSVYTVDTDSEPGQVYEAYAQTFPDHQDIEKAITITYTAGYGSNPADVPAPIRHAILLLIGHWYENREASIVGVSVTNTPRAVDALLAPYKIHRS